MNQTRDFVDQSQNTVYTSNALYIIESRAAINLLQSQFESTPNQEALHSVGQVSGFQIWHLGAP